MFRLRSHDYRYASNTSSYQDTAASRQRILLVRLPNDAGMRYMIVQSDLSCNDSMLKGASKLTTDFRRHQTVVDDLFGAARDCIA